MKILFLPRDGIRLYQELLASETSREALRFYRPVETSCGIEVTAATLGSALTLVADLRWYVKRYMRGVLFEIAPGVYCSHRLPREIYFDREITLSKSWEFRFVYRMKDGTVVSEKQILPGAECWVADTPEHPEIEVWCTEDEY